ncbi:MAG: radical SAM protein [Chloroflexi bacterium]|nr:radical SAM protein [Chloroflexota bacterium]
MHLTDKCNVRCQHCAFHCGPEVRGVMGFDDARRYLRQTVGRSLELVCITGGEPCLYFGLVADVVGEARAIGVPGIWLFTNAYWAVNRTAASRKLARLKEAGMTRLCLSADGFHQPFVPVARLRHAVAAARDLGLEIVLDVRFLGPPQEDNWTNQVTRRVLEELGDLGDAEIWQGQPLYIGRAADTLLPQVAQRSGLPKGSCPGPWAGGAWGNPAGVDVDLYGEVTLCPGISIGNAKGRSLSGILDEYDPQRHPTIRELVAGGPKRLARIAQRIGYTPRSGYASECHLCYDVRRFLRPRCSSELAPLTCYEEAVSPSGFPLMSRS